MKKGYWLAAAFTLAFVGFGLTAFQKTLTPYLSFEEAGSRAASSRSWARWTSRATATTPGARSSASTSWTRTAVTCPSCTAACGPETSRTRSRSSRSGATTRAASRPRSCSSSAPPSTRERRSRRPTRPSPPRQDLLMYVWPGVVAIWGALLFGLASAFTYLRVDRGRKDLLPLARTTYAAFARVGRRGRGDPDDADPPAPVRRLVRQLLLRRGPAAPLPDLDVLGRAGGIVPAVVLLGSAHRPLRLEQRQGAGSPGHDRLPLDVPRADRDPLPAEPVQAAAAARPDGRRGPESAAPGPLDGDPPADHVHRLRVALGPLLLRDRRALEEALGRLDHAGAAVGAADLPDARHGDPDGRLLGLQDAGLGRLLGLGPGGEHGLVPWLLRGRSSTACTSSAHASATGRSTCCSRARPTRDPLRHLPHALGRAGRLLGPQLHRPRHHRLARRDPRDVHRPVDRAAGLALALDPADGGRGVAAAVPQRLLHPRHRGLLRARLRDPARHLRPDPDAPDLDAVAGADELLREDHDAGGLAPRAAFRARSVRRLEGRDRQGLSATPAARSPSPRS